jgi:hypothetical protein
MLIYPRGETADAAIPGWAVVVIIIIIRVARCNDRIRRPIPGTQRIWGHSLFLQPAVARTFLRLPLWRTGSSQR